MEQPEKNIKLAYDGEIHLAVGASKTEKNGKIGRCLGLTLSNG